VMPNACGLDCNVCPALQRCGGRSNFCLLGRCEGCTNNPLLRMDVRRSVIDHLGGLDLTWPPDLAHPRLPELPLHLPVLVQAYADPVDLPWVAIHGGRLFGVAGRGLTPKHRRPLRDVYGLAPTTKIAIEFYVEDRVLEGLWARRSEVVREIAQLRPDLVLTPNFSVWFDQPRFLSLVQIRKANLFYAELVQAGVAAVPDISFYLFEPDGRLWAEWVNDQPTLQAVSLFCGGKKVHASKRHLRETLEDIALFHAAVRRDVAFILGGVHSPSRLAAYRQAAPGRQLAFCNGMAYALAQRRRLIGQQHVVARSARECFLINCERNDRSYASAPGHQESLRVA
jgi:Domain of unknown function (DUF4417)